MEHRAAVAAAEPHVIGGLGPRLSAAALAVPEGSVTGDIGADHGHLSLGLLASGRASFVYALDASEPALSGARQVLAQEVLKGRAFIGLGDGFDGLPMGPCKRPIQCAVLAGTGSRTALDIVRRGLCGGQRPARIVFQASAGEHDVRVGMLEMGYGIAAEELVAEGRRLFMVQSFEDGRGVTQLTDSVDIYVGPLLRDRVGPLMNAWLDVQASWLAEIEARTKDRAERAEWQSRLRSIEALRAEKRTQD